MTKISALLLASPLNYDELVAVVQNGQTRKTPIGLAFPEFFQLLCSDRSTSLTTASNVASFRAPFPFYLLDAQSEVDTVSSSGLVTVDVKKNGSSVLTTGLSIDASENSSLTAATPYVFSGVPTYAKGDLVTIDITAAGTGAKGLIVTLIARRKN